MAEEKKTKEFEKRDNEIVYSKSIKAGRRIYYLDVKRSRNDDLFIAITESKKKIYGTDQNVKVSFEKHKVFLYKEDFQSFTDALEDVVEFIKKEKGDFLTRDEYESQMRQKREEEEETASKEEVEMDNTEEKEVEEKEEKDENEEAEKDETKKNFLGFKF